MKRFGIIAALFLMLLGFSGKATAQFLPDVPDMKGKMVYGFNLGGGMYYNGYLNFSVAPQIGYRIFNPWEVGVRGLYDFTCQFGHANGNWYGHYFGISPYTNFQIYKGLFVHVEDEVLYGFSRWHHETEEQSWFNDVFVGAGYRQYSVQGNDFAYIMVLYNLSWDNPQYLKYLYPYGSAVMIRVGYCFGR